MCSAEGLGISVGKGANPQGWEGAVVRGPAHAAGPWDVMKSPYQCGSTVEPWEASCPGRGLCPLPVTQQTAGTDPCGGFAARAAPVPVDHSELTPCWDICHTARPHCPECPRTPPCVLSLDPFPRDVSKLFLTCRPKHGAFCLKGAVMQGTREPCPSQATSLWAQWFGGRN